MPRGHHRMASWLAASALAALAGSALAEPTAPGFTVRILDAGRRIDSRDLIGKKVLVVRFQASYCRPCARESAAFGRVVARYAPRGVEFVALHVQDTVGDTRRFMQAQKVTYPVALDPRLTIANRFGFKGTPYTVVIDRQGEMIARLHGVSAVTRLPRILDEALRRAPPGS